ncbi:MAG: TPM domain-containing protein [Leptonema sp. (in: bacteria)]
MHRICILLFVFLLIREVYPQTKEKNFSQEGIGGSSNITKTQKKEFVSIPELTGRVVDLTHTLTSNQIQRLEDKLRKLEEEKGSQVVVLLIPTTGIETIEEYSMKVAEKWKIGREGIDDGVILTIAKEDRQLRIEVGYGLEGVIPDAIAKRVIEEIIIPEFKKNNFYEGIDKGVDAIIRLIQGEPLPKPKRSSDEEEGLDLFIEYVGPFFFAFVLHLFFLFLFDKGMLLNYMIPILVSFIIFSLVSLFVYGFTILVLIRIFIASILGCTWYWFLALGALSGGGGGGGSYSSSRGGGFSGGGGSFGGGGASGRW